MILGRYIANNNTSGHFFAWSSFWKSVYTSLATFEEICCFQSKCWVIWNLGIFRKVTILQEYTLGLQQNCILIDSSDCIQTLYLYASVILLVNNWSSQMLYLTCIFWVKQVIKSSHGCINNFPSIMVCPTSHPQC